MLECTWKLQPVSGRVADSRVFRTAVPCGGPLPAGQAQTPQVAAMNEALARLARQIARAL